MNFTHLKAFFTVAKLKSFTKAAVELSVSQPTLSLQVQSLENQYDIVLINRTKKSIELTEEGKPFIHLPIVSFHCHGIWKTPSKI